MALDTIDKIAHQVLLHNRDAGKPLAALWALNSFNHLADMREWSWRTRYSEFIVPDAYSTGTVSITSADPTLVIGSGTTFTADMVGRQFRIGYSFGYDITDFIDATHIRINLPWGDADQSNVGYQIVQQYLTPPDDFQSFISVIDPTRNYKIRTGVERRELDRRDPRRTTTGIPYVIAEAGYGQSFSGSVDLAPFLAKGTSTDPTPLFTGAFTGPVDSVFVVEVTTGGSPGGALVVRWKKGNGTYVSGVAVPDSSAIGLQDGVSVYFPAAAYVLGDIFIARAKSVQSAGIPRYEMWPLQLTRSVYPFYYLAQIPDLSLSPALTLPRGIRGDVVLKGALAELQMWAGRSKDTPNPLFDPKAAVARKAEFEHEIDILALRDDDIYPKDVSYYKDLPFAGPPWDASWEQRHQ